MLLSTKDSFKRISTLPLLLGGCPRHGWNTSGVISRAINPWTAWGTDLTATIVVLTGVVLISFIRDVNGSLLVWEGEEW